MRLADSPAIVAAICWLPPDRDLVAAALAAGRVDEKTAASDGYLELPVSHDRAAPEMAVAAARKALADAGWCGEELRLVVHAWTHHQGHDFWSPAHYVAHGIGAREALPVGIQQMCNGGAAGVEVAVTRMAVDPAVDRALVTTADRFTDPRFDRWRGDYGVAYGDGATALLLTRGDGPYRLLSVATVAAPELEVMHRGDDPFRPAPQERVDIRRTKKAFLTVGGGPRFAAIAGASVLRVVREALADAGLAVDDPQIRYLALPRLGARVLDEAYRPHLAELGITAEVLAPGARSGHLGAGDAAATLAELHDHAALAPGEVALLVSAGAGFTWSCLAVQAVT